MEHNEKDLVKEALAADHVCYVLITCKKSPNGEAMEVELDYEGDTALAAYLVHGAKRFFDEESGEACLEAHF